LNYGLLKLLTLLLLFILLLFTPQRSSVFYFYSILSPCFYSCYVTRNMFFNNNAFFRYRQAYSY